MYKHHTKKIKKKRRSHSRTNYILHVLPSDVTVGQSMKFTTCMHTAC